MIVYLTSENVLRINAKVLGGETRLRDSGLLESALGRPMASAFGEDAYPSFFHKAAALLDSLSRNHPFVDGNKRTATLATAAFLEINGYEAIWDASEALQFILAVAQGQHDIETIAEWLKNNVDETREE
ncbi:MAG: type II toxin-antitoxin system death-on-curing family toxin [Anaerolineae bacterium]|nr:type II toxin-antitoxin system death-on-curing family toxin [Anaerolineae bacterium]